MRCSELKVNLSQLQLVVPPAHMAALWKRAASHCDLVRGRCAAAHPWGPHPVHRIQSSSALERGFIHGGVRTSPVSSLRTTTEEKVAGALATSAISLSPLAFTPAARA